MRQFAGIRTTTPARSSAGRMPQKLQRLLRAPAQWMIDFAAVDHHLQPAASLGSTLNRHKQRQQTLAILGPGIFLQGRAKWHVLRLGLRRQPCGVGGKEGEWRFFDLPVFREVECTRPTRFQAG
jgi:hypothetical protein